MAEKGLPALTPKWGRPKLLVQTKQKPPQSPKYYQALEISKKVGTYLIHQINQPSCLINHLTYQILQICHLHHLSQHTSKIHLIHQIHHLIQQIHHQILHLTLQIHQTHQLLHQTHMIQWFHQILPSHSS